MNEIEIFLKEMRFEENDFGFLEGNIDCINFILMHNPLNGYTLQYSYITKREVAFNSIALGRHPTLDTLEEAFKKVYNR